MKKWLTDIQFVTVAQRAANNSTQHVSAIFIARLDAIGDQKSTAADVICNNPQGGSV